MMQHISALLRIQISQYALPQSSFPEHRSTIFARETPAFTPKVDILIVGRISTPYLVGVLCVAQLEFTWQAT